MRQAHEHPGRTRAVFRPLHQQAKLVRNVGELVFAQARAKLSVAAIPQLNDWLIQRARHHGFVPLWRGVRLGRP